MMRNKLPSQAYLLNAFRYDNETGILYWRERLDAPAKWNGRYAGKPAGTDRGNQTIVSLAGKLYRAHRIIWKMSYGTEPHEIDHRDLDGRNNRIENLREATHQQNMRNVAGRAKSGAKGVSLHAKTGLWRARVWVGGRDVCKYFKSFDAARVAYASLAKEHYGEFARIS